MDTPHASSYASYQTFSIASRSNTLGLPATELNTFETTRLHTSSAISIVMAQGGPSRSPASDPGMTSSVTPDDPPEALVMDPIASEWQRLASMDQQSPDFLPLLSTLTVGGNQSPTTNLRGENARIVLSTLDEVGCPFTAE